MAKAMKTKARASRQSLAQRSAAGKIRKLTTMVTFTADDLSALADYMAAGMVMLRITTPHKAVGKFKAAMSRLKVPAPRGL